MCQSCEFGSESWFQHNCIFSTDFSGSWLWWQSRNVVKNYADCRRCWTKYIIFFTFSLSRENIAQTTRSSAGNFREDPEKQRIQCLLCRAISTVRSPSYSCLPAICSGLTLGSGEKPMASKGIWYNHWPFLTSQAVMTVDLFSFGVL